MQRDEWERARWQMFLAMQMHPYIKQHQKAKTPQEWIAFAWERSEQRSSDPSQFIMSKEERKAAIAMFERMKEKKNNG